MTHNPHERSLSQRAQRAFELLVGGKRVPKKEREDLIRARARLVIQQGNRGGLFDLAEDSLLETKPDTGVVIRAKTGDGVGEFELGVDAEGRSNFRISEIAEIIDDPA